MENGHAPHPSFTFEGASAGISEFLHRSNQLQVLVLPQTVAPVATFMVTYRVGSRHESAGLTGATHFLEHLMFKGSKNFNRANGKTVFDVLQNVGARVNATTWYDRTNYYELLPKEHLGLAVSIEADRMRGALLDPDDVELERTVILNELDRGENEPVRKLFHDVWSAAYMAHGYHHPTIGWRSDVEAVTSDGLRHFYDAYYWPNNATISVIGDVDVKEALTLVDEHFGSIPASPEGIRMPLTREPEQRGERRLQVRLAGQLGAVMLAYKAPPARDPDSDALEVLATILASGKNSRLYRALTDQGRATSVFASTSGLFDPGLFYVYAFCAPGHTHEEIEQAIEEVLNQVVEKGVTKGEIDRARNQIRAQEAYGRDGSFSVAARLNEAIAAGDWKLYTTFEERIAHIEPDNVQGVAERYFKTERRTVGYYVPTSESPEGKQTELENELEEDIESVVDNREDAS